MSWFDRLGKSAQGVVAIAAIIIVTVAAATASVRFIAIPGELEAMDVLHTERMDYIEMRQESYEETTTEQLTHILRSVESLDLRLCLEQADRDQTDPRLCAEIP